jgi:hypothetical protein
LGVVETCRDSIIQGFQAIDESRFYDAKATLEIIKLLLPYTSVPDDYFLDVVATVEDVRIRAIKDHEFDDAKSALEIIQRLMDINTMLSKNKKVDLLVV